MTLDSSGLIRKAENPFSLLPRFSKSWFLSLAYLHFRYAWLLAFPRTLCAEYSFNWYVLAFSEVIARHFHMRVSVYLQSNHLWIFETF